MSTATASYKYGLQYNDDLDPVKLHQYFSDSNLFGSNPSLPKVQYGTSVGFKSLPTPSRSPIPSHVPKKDVQLSYSDDDHVPVLNDSFSFESAKSFTTSNFHMESPSADHDDSDTPIMTPSYSSVTSTDTTSSTGTISSISSISPTTSLRVTRPDHNHSSGSAELIVLQEEDEECSEDDMLELSHVSSIEGDLHDILSLDESAYRDPKAVHFISHALSVSYSVSADIDPSELKIPESRGGGDGREGLKAMNNLLSVQPVCCCIVLAQYLVMIHHHIQCPIR